MKPVAERGIYLYCTETPGRSPGYYCRQIASLPPGVGVTPPVTTMTTVEPTTATTDPTTITRTTETRPTTVTSIVETTTAASPDS